MSYLRAVTRTMGIIATYSVSALFGIFLHILFFGSRRKLYYWLSVATYYLARCSCFLFNIQIKVVGERARIPGALIIANHVGTPDIFVLASCFPTFFVSKLEFRDWPALGLLTRLGKTIFVDRDRRHAVKATIEEICERLEADCQVALFPEGGVTNGEDVAPFRTPYFEAAVLSRRPVLPVLIQYHDGHTPSIACWANMSFYRHILTLLKNPRLDVTVTVLPQVAGPDRRYLASESFRLLREEYRRAGK